MNKDSQLIWEAYAQQEVIEEGVKDIMLGVLCALGISCAMSPKSPGFVLPADRPLYPGFQPAWGVPSKGNSPYLRPRSPAPHVKTSPKSVDPTTPAVPKQMNRAKPDETFGAAWRRTSLANIKNPETRKVMTNLMSKEIKNWFNENPKAADRLSEILLDKTNDMLNLSLNWGPEPEYGWPGWNEVMKKVESAIAQPK